MPRSSCCKKSESVGQQRMRSLHDGSREDLEVSPNLWAGIGLVRPGAGTALVGSHEQVAERLLEYHDLGLDEFILSGHPHLEEAYAVGEGRAPEVDRGRRAPGRERTAPLLTTSSPRPEARSPPASR